MFDENGAVAQCDAQRKERRLLESQQRFVSVIAVDRVAPDTSESDCYAVRQRVGLTGIKIAQHVKCVDDGMGGLRFGRQADEPREAGQDVEGSLNDKPLEQPIVDDQDVMLVEPAF